jgi:hypothetical protein
MPVLWPRNRHPGPTGLPANEWSQTLLSEPVTSQGCPAILPDDGVADRLTRAPLPDDGCFPLVGDAHAFHLRGGHFSFLESFIRHCQ